MSPPGIRGVLRASLWEMRNRWMRLLRPLHAPKIPPFSIYYSIVINNPRRGPPPAGLPFSPVGDSAGPLPLLGQEQPLIPHRVPGQIAARRAILVIPVIPVLSPPPRTPTMAPSPNQS